MQVTPCQFCEGKGWSRHKGMVDLGFVECKMCRGTGDKAKGLSAEMKDYKKWKETKKSDERMLFDGVKQRHKELSDLLDKVNDHWTYEDGIYRYYHHSFKVYYRLQPVTEKIVETLQSLVPGRELNRLFLEILKEGTGKEFHVDHNQAWSRFTRPIVEAFFHAKFFLEQAVRYGEELKDESDPPQMLPSGWAALLYLYNLR